MNYEDKFDVLADRWLSHDLTDSEWNELANQLESDELFAEHLKNQLLIDGMLSTATDREPIMSASPSLYINGSHGATPRMRRLFYILTTVGTTALIVLIAMIFRLTWVYNQISDQKDISAIATFQPGKNHNETSTVCNAVAMIVQLDSVRWKTGSPVYGQDDMIAPGWLRLDSGTVQLEFFSGARVSINGPADFMVVSQHVAYCSQGTLVAHVPRQAVGFTIDVPQMTIIDRGTEFSLDVTPKLARVCVLKGEVELDQLPGGRKQLREGEGASVSSDGQVKNLEPDSSLRNISLNTRDSSDNLELEACRKRRAEFAHLLDNDPCSLIHFNITDQDTQGNTLTNLAAFGRKTNGDGTRVCCDWGTGSLPTIRSLEFRRVSDRVRVLVRDSVRSMTLFARVRIDSLERSDMSLMTSDSYRRSGIDWHICRPFKNQSPRLRLDVFDENSDAIHHYEVKLPLESRDLGRWVSLATVVDTEKKYVSHYMNGKLVGHKRLEHEFALRIGLAELGNAAGKSSQDTFQVRNLCGAMDEFILSTKALTSHELQQLN